MVEIIFWDNIPDYPKYEASRCGKIKSFHKKKEKLLKQCFDRGGYQAVILCNDKGKKQMMIHTIIARVFLGERPKGFVIDHINRVKTDNNVENLRYVTPSENSINTINKGGVYKRNRDNKISYELRFSIRPRPHPRYNKYFKSLFSAQIHLQYLRIVVSKRPWK